MIMTAPSQVDLMRQEVAEESSPTLKLVLMINAFNRSHTRFFACPFSHFVRVIIVFLKKRIKI